MFITHTPKWIAVFALFIAFALSACTLAVPPVVQQNSTSGTAGELVAVELIEFDVAENPSLFAFDQTNVFDDGMPAYGNAFITQGYIYPKGTLEGATPGVNADGSPLYPDKVLGTWICKGWFIADGAHTATGPVAATTQIYQFNESYNNATIITEGYELADAGVPITRAITGGTGEFARARGVAQQTLLGMTEYMGVNLRFQVELSQ